MTRATVSVTPRRHHDRGGPGGEPTGKAWIAWNDKLTGFGVRVYPSGRKSYIVNYRDGDGGRKAPNKRVMLGRCDPPPERRLYNYGPSIAECAMEAKRTDRAVKCSFAAHKP